MGCAFCFCRDGGWCGRRIRSRCWCCASKRRRRTYWRNINKRWSRLSPGRLRSECGLAFGAASERLDDGSAADRDACFGERVQKIVEQRVEDLLGERLLA